MRLAWLYGLCSCIFLIWIICSPMKHRTRTLHWRQLVYRLSIGLALAQVVLIFLSWLLSAAMPQSSIISLLSARGIRWFFGYFVESEASAPLLWLILGVFTLGGMRGSNLLTALSQGVKSGFPSLPRRVKLALITAGSFGILQIGCLLLLTVPPQAVLLSVTGTLSDSSFSASIVPSACFMLTTVSIAYSNCILATGTLMIIMPLIILYLFAQRAFVESISTSGIKM